MSWKYFIGLSFESFRLFQPHRNVPLESKYSSTTYCYGITSVLSATILLFVIDMFALVSLKFRRIFLLLSLICLLPNAWANGPLVTVSIKPIHSLVAAVMQGVAEPVLLIPANQSPHNFSLRPSDIKKLQSSDLIIWLGDTFETPLEHILRTTMKDRRTISLLQQPEILRLNARKGGVWEIQKRNDKSETHRHHYETDPHIWLSTKNAVEVVRILSDVLSEIDPNNRHHYQKNSQIVQQRLERLESELETGFSEVRNIPFLVFHDAYQYLEQQFGLHAVGSITIGPERQPGAKRIQQIHSKINRLEARCVFSEPQFKPKLVDMLTQYTEIKSGILDPIGTELENGPDAYFLLLQNLKGNLIACLKESP